MISIPPICLNLATSGNRVMPVASSRVPGLCALLLVLSRTPGSQALFPWVDFFRTALVVHVNQSVLIWFLAMAGVISTD